MKTIVPLDQFRKLSQDTRITVLERILSNPKLASLGNPFVFDSLGDTEHGFDARTRALIELMLPKLGPQFLEPTNNAFPLVKEGAFKTYGEEKESLFRVPFVYPRLHKFGSVKQTMFVSLSGPNIEIQDNIDNPYSIPEYCEYATIVKQGLLPEGYRGITNDVYDHNLNFLGYEAGLLPKPTFGDWQDGIVQHIQEYKTSNKFKFLALNLDATCTLRTLESCIASTATCLKRVLKPWFIMVNVSHPVWSDSEDRAKTSVWSDINNINWNKMGLDLVESEASHLFYSQTKVVKMVAFTLVKL